MFCPRCGVEIKEDAAFCPQCGTSISCEASAGAALASAMPAQGKQVDSALAASAIPAQGKPASTAAQTTTMPVKEQAAAQPQAKKPRKRTAIIATVAAVVVIAAGVGIGLWWKSEQDAKAAAQAAWELAHTSLVTQVTVEAPGFDDSATAIPMQVTGTDLDGNAVNEIQFLHPGAMQITTLAGSYDVSFPGGYFTGTGGVMRAPNTTQHIELAAPTDGNQGASGSESQSSASVSAQEVSSSSSQDSASSGPQNSAGASQSSASGTLDNAADGAQATATDSGSFPSATAVLQPVTYTEVPALEVTDDLLNQITELAAQDPADNGKASQLIQVALANHQTAVAEEARKAEEARVEARKAQIAQTAEEYLYCMYDNYGARGQAIRAARQQDNMYGFVNDRRSLQSGWPITRMLSFGGVQAISENEVTYSLTYECTMGPGNSPSSWKWKNDEDSGRIAFGENGLIDQWYPKGSPNGRFFKY